MTKHEAIHAVCLAFGGQCRPGQDPPSILYQFPNLDAADQAKGVLDALLPPGHTGKVVASGFLCVAVPE